MTQWMLIAGVIILVCIIFNKLSDRAGIPVLLAFIALGMLFGSDGIFKIPFENFLFAEKICSVALLFIIFYGGFGTNWREAKNVAGKSLLLSSVGVLLTAGITGLLCHFALGFGWAESFLVGAALGSTDAASVFSILRAKKLGLKYGTASMLELESGSNDPWAYMLTVIILSFMKAPMTAGSMVLMILSQIFFGVLLGFGTAFLAVLILKHAKMEKQGFDSLFLIAAALIAYTVPTLLGGNGYISVYIAGIVLGNQKFEGKGAIVHFFDGITGLFQILLFFLLGLLSFPSRLPAVILPAVLIFIFITLIARPIAVFAILSPFRARISQMVTVSFAGLRGAASIVFAILAAVSGTSTGNDIFHIVFFVVLLSIALQGTFLPKISRKLKMTDSEENVLRTFSDYTDETKIQFISLHVTENHYWHDKTVREISLPPETRIVVILRAGEKIIPRGKTKLQSGDTLILNAAGYSDDTIALTETRIGRSHEWRDKKLSEISMTDTIVVLIRRDGKNIIPTGDVTIREKDDVVLLSE